MLRRHRLALLLAAVSILALTLTAVAIGDDGASRHGGRQSHYQKTTAREDHRGEHGSFFRSSLAPSLPSDPALHGVSAGGAPWSLQKGQVSVDRDGSLRLEVEGLVLTSLGNAGPVKTVAAALFCGTDTTAAATTGSTPLSSGGDAELEATLDLPATCLAPIVLVQPNGSTGIYIAVSGFRG